MLKSIKPCLGEMAVTLNRKTIGLRPSFEALHAIEQHLGSTIPVLIHTLQTHSVPTATLRYILASCAYAWDKTQILPTFPARAWRSLQATALELLMRGLGCTPVFATEAPSSLPTPPTTPTQLSWPSLYQSVTVLFGKSEAEFWQMTMHGLLLMLEGYRAQQGEDFLPIGIPATARDLHALMQQFPDHI